MKIIKWVLIVIIGTVVLGWLSIKLISQYNQKNSSETWNQICTNNGGVWLPEYKECEGTDNMISETDCTKFKGQYFECESPCRHSLSPETCVTLCMKVCKF
jgi:hypothetical protein